MTIILTPDELARLTGYKLRCHQARFLDAARLPYRRNKSGCILVERSVAVRWLGGNASQPEATAPAANAPDFGALRLIRRAESA